MKEDFQIKEWKEIPNEARPKIRYWMPAAAVDFADLKEEIRQLKERGFGGIEVVVLSILPEEILLGEEGWGGERWNETVRVIADTCAGLWLAGVCFFSAAFPEPDSPG